MPHKLRKTRKKRGSRTQGYGRVGQHRSSGSRGFRKPGKHKEGWSYVLRYEPNYFGKKGFSSIQSLKQKTVIINIKQLDQIAEKYSTRTKKDQQLLDLEALGYNKLVGSGRISKALLVKVASWSKSATKKIEHVGGKIRGSF
jgi:large subunit ribosomal protein L15